MQFHHAYLKRFQFVRVLIQRAPTLTCSAADFLELTMDPSDINNYLDNTAHGDDIDMAQWGQNDESLPSFSEFLKMDTGSSSRAQPGPSSKKRKLTDCDNCGAHFRRSDALRVHKKRFHGALQTVSCTHCRGTFSTERQLRHHMKERHPGENTKQSMQCENCGQKFSSNNGIHRHQREFHDPPQKARCKLCPATFAKESQVTLHLRAVHQKDVRFSSGAAQCSECGLLCQEDNIERHVQSMHRGELKVHCSDCNAWFRNARQLNAHKRKMHE